MPQTRCRGRFPDYHSWQVCMPHADLQKLAVGGSPPTTIPSCSSFRRRKVSRLSVRVDTLREFCFAFMVFSKEPDKTAGNKTLKCGKHDTTKA
jgi:hypothetical protein